MIVQVDAFTDEPFRGNPAAVCVMTSAADENWMQKVAREMNLSETAFLYRDNSGYQLRWFTPAVEMVLCGHATLASAHVLWEDGHCKPEETIRFFTRSGELTATRKNRWTELNFPSDPVSEAPPPDGLITALGAEPKFIGKGKSDYLVEIADEKTLRRLSPDFSALARLTENGVIVTSRSAEAGYDFVSRLFAPAIGINEDPVTGSVHCSLTPYWSERLGKNELRAYQASDRGGVLRVALDGDRVRIAGQAVTVMRCELL
jgi:PhzF family phenazine biosynthesis protein